MEQLEVLVVGESFACVVQIVAHFDRHGVIAVPIAEVFVDELRESLRSTVLVARDGRIERCERAEILPVYRRDDVRSISLE